jgi:hypothetical protein
LPYYNISLDYNNECTPHLLVYMVERKLPLA